MNEKINGVIVAGKVYEAKYFRSSNPCNECDFKEACTSYKFTDACWEIVGEDGNLRFSQTLTDKLNKQ